VRIIFLAARIQGALPGFFSIKTVFRPIFAVASSPYALGETGLFRARRFVRVATVFVGHTGPGSDKLKSEGLLAAIAESHARIVVPDDDHIVLAVRISNGTLKATDALLTATSDAVGSGRSPVLRRICGLATLAQRGMPFAAGSAQGKRDDWPAPGTARARLRQPR
jgi:hypothetical protein